MLFKNTVSLGVFLLLVWPAAAFFFGSKSEGTKDNIFMTLGDLAEKIKSLCFKLNDVKGILDSPMLKIIVGDKMLDQELPFPSPLALDPTGLMYSLYTNLGSFSDYLVAKLNTENATTPVPEEDKAEEEPASTPEDKPEEIPPWKSTYIRPKDLLDVTDWTCKHLNMIASVISNPYTGMILRHIRLPIFNPDNPQASWKALDRFGLAELPQKIKNLKFGK